MSDVKKVQLAKDWLVAQILTNSTVCCVCKGHRHELFRNNRSRYYGKLVEWMCVGV